MPGSVFRQLRSFVVPIGRFNADVTDPFVAFRFRTSDDQRESVWMSVHNDGDADMTITVQSSSDDGADDAYAARGIRYGVATVANGQVTVVPGGVASIVVENLDYTDDKFVRVLVTPTTSRGAIGVTVPLGSVDPLI